MPSWRSAAEATGSPPSLSQTACAALPALNVPIDPTPAWPGALLPRFVDPHAGWQPDPDLEAFIAVVPPPVYIGFGSMGTDDPRAAARLVLDAVHAAGVRAIVHRGRTTIRADDTR